MNIVSGSSLDLIKELRLRRWARSNYVPNDERSTGWHPVILQEMECRDEEIAAREEPMSISMRYVPLAPDEPRLLPFGHYLIRRDERGELAMPHIAFYATTTTPAG